MNGKSTVLKVFLGIVAAIGNFFRFTGVITVAGVTARANIARTYSEHKGYTQRGTIAAVRYSQLCGGLAIIISAIIGFSIAVGVGQYNRKSADAAGGARSVSNAEYLAGGAERRPNEAVGSIRKSVSDIERASAVATSDASSAGRFSVDERGATVLTLDGRKYVLSEVKDGK